MATVTMHCTPDDDDYSDNEIISIRFSVYDSIESEKINVISVGGFTFENNKTDISICLGKPSREFEHDGGQTKTSYYYELSSSSSIHFFFNNDGDVTEIGIVKITQE